ncbi:MAG TPA: AMP-binding protein [Stellaceae bacterium]|nr:AMP-binding protein [Stellaceae bacterium]
MLTFGDLVRRNGRRWSGKDAFVELDRRVSWGEFDARTDALGHALRALGVRPGDRVAMLTADCIEVAEVFVACAKIGAIRVGLNARLARPEIAALLADSEPHLLFVRRDCLHLIASMQDGRACKPLLIGFGPSHGIATDYEDLVERHRRDGELAQTPSDVVMIAYTTGSTGLPKGAIYPHSKFLTSILYTALYEGIVHESIWLHAMPAAGIPIMHMMRNVFHGGTTVIVGAWDPDRALLLLDRERTTNCVLVPTMLNSLLACESLGKRDVSSMRILGYGASPLPAATIREAMTAFRRPFLQMYGTTELMGMSMMLLPSDHELGLSARPEILASAGKPLSFVDVRIVDDERRDVAAGEIGELIIRSETQFPGYWRAPDKYAETVIDGWLFTGDMARQDQGGYIYLSDRAKFRIKTGGYNVFPTEVENVLALHPAIDEVAVVGLPDDTWGERIHAVVTLKPRAEATPAELRDFCRNKIASFKIPKSVDIWTHMPKGPTGKIQKRAIIDSLSVR